MPDFSLADILLAQPSGGAFGTLSPQEEAQRQVTPADVLSGLYRGVEDTARRNIEASRRQEIDPGAALSAAGLVVGATPFGMPGGTALGSGPLGSSSLATARRIAEDLPPLPPRNTGSLNPLANEPVRFRGAEPSQFTPEDWQAFGEAHNVPKPLGPLSPVEKITDPKTGSVIEVPGGLNGEWTYYDLLHMKANPINPNDISPELHAQLQQKIGRTMTSPGGPTDAHNFAGLVFGMTSPSNPLFSNQLAMSRLRLRDPKMLDDLASSIPWKAGEEVPPQVRLQASKQIADRFGLGAEESGGLGVRGNADYTRLAELAQMFRENPGFFRKQAGEEWPQFVERISSQVPGLGMKTGSFGTVWQAPAEASVSAIDRHMARELEKTGELFASPEQRASFEQRAVDRYNKGRPKADQVTSYDELAAKPTESLTGGMLLEHVGASSEPRFRLATGEINPNIPQHLQQAPWVVEPQTVKVMGPAYKNALALNQRLAEEQGLGLFNSQWHTWDRIRQRFEPHENMFPGLENLPAPSIEQLRAVQEAHGITGHKATTKTEEGKLRPTKPYPGNPSALGYLSLGGLLGAYANEKNQ